MTFLLDQDVPDPIARVIQQAGHIVHRLRDLASAESTDEQVLALCYERNFLRLLQAAGAEGLSNNINFA